VDCVLDAQAATGEGAVWSVGEQALWWVDIPNGRLHRYDPSSRNNRTWTMPSPLGCFALRRNGGLVVALVDGWHAFDPATGALEHWHDPEPERPANRFNDGATDRTGRFWAGTMPLAGVGSAPEGALFRLDRNRTSARILDGLWIQNGLAFSPDGGTMYLSDSYVAIRTIWAFDYDQDVGLPRNRRILFDTRSLPGRPDGAAIDAEGCYWFAAVGGWEIIRLTPDGRIDRRIPVPVERPTKVAFGGPSLETLYITSMRAGIDPSEVHRQPYAGGIFAADVGIGGLPMALFEG
jgi:L-arabinonolactonase